MPKTETHLGFLDYFRGVAILLVFAFHALGQNFGQDAFAWKGWFPDFHGVSTAFLLLSPVTLGWAGVSIFFVISGFCIHLSHEKSKSKSFKVFFARRFFRIYPPYLVALVIFSFLVPWRRLSLVTADGCTQFFSHLFLVHNLGDSTFYRINFSFWSIAVEAQLYLLYPLLLVLARRLGWNGALFITGAIELSLRAVSTAHPMPRWFADSPFSFWFSWSIGAAVADDFLAGRMPRLGRCPVWIWPGLIVICDVFKPLSEFCFTAIALFTANAIAVLLMPGAAGRGEFRQLLPGPMKWVGKISYSIYLIHHPCLIHFAAYFAKSPALRNFSPITVFGLSFLIVWPVVLVFSWAFFRLVEQPAIGLGKWFVARMNPMATR